MILPDVISKEPLGPVVRGNDRQWIDIVEWVHFAMLNAEELGVSTRGNDVGESRRFCVSSAIPQISAGRSDSRTPGPPSGRPKYAKGSRLLATANFGTVQFEFQVPTRSARSRSVPLRKECAHKRSLT